MFLSQQNRCDKKGIEMLTLLAWTVVVNIQFYGHGESNEQSKQSDWRVAAFVGMKLGGFKARFPDSAVLVTQLRQWSYHVVGTDLRILYLNSALSAHFLLKLWETYFKVCNSPPPDYVLLSFPDMIFGLDLDKATDGMWTSTDIFFHLFLKHTS